MAKLTGPLMSFGAKGSLGKTVVVSSWRGVKYMRQYVTPANPNTTAQQTVRGTFALLREMWKLAPAPVIATWESFAQGRPFTGMNKFVGENIRVLNGVSDMQNFIGSPGSKGGFPPSSFDVVTGGSAGEIDFTFTAPTPPDGWALVQVAVSAFQDQDPSVFFEGPYVATTEDAPTLTGTIDGLPTGEDCVVSGWLVWSKPNGQLAYSVGLTDVIAAG